MRVEHKRSRFSGKSVFAHKEHGYTLVELMIGIVLIGMLAVSFFTLFTALVRSALIIKRKAVASTLATTKMEELRALAYADLAISGGPFIPPNGYLPSTSTTKINNVTYTTTISIDSIDDAFDGCISYPNVALEQSQCRGFVVHSGAPTNDTNAQDYKIVHVKVSDSSNLILAQVDSMIAGSVAETASTSGALFVTVLDQSGNPLPNVTVRVTNSTTTPTIDRTLSSEDNGIAAFYNLPPDTSNNDYVITASLSGYSTLKSIAPNGTLQPNYSSQNVLTQASSSLTMRLNRQASNSLEIEATDTNGTALSGLKVFMKGGYKKYTLTTDTSYYYNNTATTASIIPPNMAAGDNRQSTDAAGHIVLTDLVPGPYVFCGDDGAGSGTSSCQIGNTTYYLVAAVPSGGSNSFNPISVPAYDPSASQPTFDGSLQKVNLIFSTSSTFPRVFTLSPDDATLSSGTLNSFAFKITGANLPTSANSVKLLQGANTYTASCSGSSTTLNCTINISSASTGPTQLQVKNGANTLTIPSAFSLGGISVSP